MIFFSIKWDLLNYFGIFLFSGPRGWVAKRRRCIAELYDKYDVLITSDTDVYDILWLYNQVIVMYDVYLWHVCKTYMKFTWHVNIDDVHGMGVNTIHIRCITYGVYMMYISIIWHVNIAYVWCRWGKYDSYTIYIAYGVYMMYI